jgi:membrane fusion protein (multidrug efflux system)
MSSRDGRVVRGILWALTVALAAGIVLLVARKAPPPPALPQIEKPIVVRVLTLAPQPVPDVQHLTGRIQAMRDALLAIEQEGVITELHVDRGSRAKAGDVLLRTDTRTWQAAVDRAVVAAADAARDLRRWTELKGAGAVADAEFEAVRSRGALADAALADARARLQQCEVVAPFDGTVDERWIERGEFIGRAKPALRLVDSTRIKVRFSVPERDVLRVQAAAPVAFTIAALPGQTFTGTVAFISQAADEASNAYAVELIAENADGRLRPGMIADVALVRRVLADALVVPLAAVVPHKGEHVVYLAETSGSGTNRAVRRVVQMDAPQGHEVVLSRGVRAGERVIVEGQREIQDGALLDVRGESLAKAP